jgi:hypothetical protein
MSDRRTQTRLFPPGDYADRLSALWASLQAAAEDETPRLATEAGAVEELRAEYEALKTEATKAAKAARRFVRMEALSRGAMRDLKAKHPPRTEGEDEDTLKADRVNGLNLKSVEDDLVYASVVEPAFTSRGDFDEWVDRDLSDGEFDILLQTAWELANVGRFDPKPLPASLTRKSDATSE